MFNNEFRNNFEKNYNTTNKALDQLRFQQNLQATGLNSIIKVEDQEGFKMFSDMILKRK